MGDDVLFSSGVELGLHVTSQGVCSGTPLRTTGAVFYDENVQRLPLVLAK